MKKAEEILNKHITQRGSITDGNFTCVAIKYEDAIKAVSEALQPEIKRYCKGCLCDVTKTMFCYCGEFPLTKDSTYTDEDMKNLNI